MIQLPIKRRKQRIKLRDRLQTFKKGKERAGPKAVQQTQCFLNRQQGQDPSEDRRPSEAVKWKADVAGIPSKYLSPSLLLELLS